MGRAIPHIQSLAVLKTGTNAGLPDDGIKEFWPDYPNMSQAEKRRRVKTEYSRIVDFGSRWNDVLERLQLSPILLETVLAGLHGVGGSGESPQHAALKQFVHDHPEIVGASEQSDRFMEYPLPTQDEVDVVFKTTNECVAVEVKARVSEAPLSRGL